TWVLQEIKRQLAQVTSVFLSWHEFSASQSGLFLWEAFVTGKAKGDSHTADARLGAEAFACALPDPMSCNAVTCANGVHSLVGAALLRTGWSDDLRLLQEPCLVVRAHVAEQFVQADAASFRQAHGRYSLPCAWLHCAARLNLGVRCHGKFARAIS